MLVKGDGDCGVTDEGSDIEVRDTGTSYNGKPSVGGKAPSRFEQDLVTGMPISGPDVILVSTAIMYLNSGLTLSYSHWTKDLDKEDDRQQWCLAWVLREQEQSNMVSGNAPFLWLPD